MGIVNPFKKLNRKFWFVCYSCMQQTSHDTMKSVFYYEGPPIVEMGRSFTLCPRCQGNNTVSFQQLKDDGSEAQLWGLEQTVKQHPRSYFQIKSEGVKTTH